MAAPSSDVCHYRARVGALSRDRLPDDPEFVEARRNLAAANLEATVLKVITSAPPLTTEQRERITELLKGANT